MRKENYNKNYQRSRQNQQQDAFISTPVPSNGATRTVAMSLTIKIIHKKYQQIIATTKSFKNTLGVYDYVTFWSL